MEKEKQLITDKIPLSNNIIIWAIIALSILSCISSPDYNIIIGFLILFFLGVNNSEKQQTISRVKVQIIIISLVFDILWILKHNAYWTHGEETSELWRSLSFAHNLAFFLFVIEFLLKIYLCFCLYKDFAANQGTAKDLLNFNYNAKTEKINDNI